MAEHRVELVEVLDALGDLVGADAKLLGEGVLRAVVVRQEFMKRRIEQADRGGIAIERLEDAGEILALVGEELGECVDAFAGLLGQNHFAHGINPVALEEHVFRAGEADAGGAERDRILGLLRIVGIGANLEAGDF